MKRYKTLILFLILVAIWGAFFSGLKFFLWGVLDTTIKPTLQDIAGYLSLGGIFAYIIGGSLVLVFLKKYFMCIISFFSLLLVLYGYFIGFSNSITFGIVITLIGFLYGLWNIIKNIIIAIEIRKTKLPETTINALAGIIFVVFIIGGSLMGNILFSTMGQEGYLILAIMLLIITVVGYNLDYDGITFKSLIKDGWASYFVKKKQALKLSFKEYLPNLQYVLKHYFLIIFGSSLLWVISTIVSQASIEYSVDHFSVTPTVATSILLYSALGAILGNIISMKMNKNRWKFYIFTNSIFALLILSFPFLALTFSFLAILAFFLGLFFGISSNLVDSYLLKKIGEDNKKEHGSSAYGLILSIIIFIMMFFSSWVLKEYNYTVLMLVLGSIMLTMGVYLYKKQR